MAAQQDDMTSPERRISLASNTINTSPTRRASLVSQTFHTFPEASAFHSSQMNLSIIYELTFTPDNGMFIPSHLLPRP